MIRRIVGRPGSIEQDERVIFFPTAADFTDGAWHVPLHGWIFRPAALSRVRRLDLWLLRHIVRRRVALDDAAIAIFNQRAGAFLADNTRRQRLTIQIGGQIVRLGKSRANGHFGGRFTLTSAPAQGLAGAQQSGQHAWLPFQLANPDGGGPGASGGRVLLLQPEGLSIISDIDDTIKITQVKQRRRMLRHTFLEEFASVPAMARLYQQWAAGGAAFHYVSATPWHLYPFLAEFLARHSFPEGTFHLRDFRLMPGSLHRALGPARQVKRKHARELLCRFPRRRFILVGDSGESDAAIYARLYAEFPGQVEKILIRKIGGEIGTVERSLRQVPANIWSLFADPRKLGSSCSII